MLSLLFWLFGTAGMLLLVYGLNRLVISIRVFGVLPSGGAAMTGATTQPWPGGPEEQMFWGTSLIHHSLPYIAGSMISFLLAALFTVLLVFSSRRANTGAD